MRALTVTTRPSRARVRRRRRAGGAASARGSRGGMIFRVSAAWGEASFILRAARGGACETRPVRALPAMSPTRGALPDARAPPPLHLHRASLTSASPRSPSLLQVGMRHFHKQKNHYHCPIINLDKLWTLVGEEKRVECAKDTSKAPVIDLTDYGIFKLLGKGQLPKQPVVVKARYISKLAEKKIKEVGGACLLTA